MPPPPYDAHMMPNEGLAVHPTPTVFGPDEYSYVDVSGVIQGPFSFNQLQVWISQNLFPPTLYTRRGHEMFLELGELGLMSYSSDPIERKVPWRENMWYYLDRQATQQGPYPYDQILNWVQQNFLTPEILVRCGEGSGPFTPLAKTVFMVVPQPGSPSGSSQSTMPQEIMSQQGDSWNNFARNQPDSEEGEEIKRLKSEVADLRRQLGKREKELSERTEMLATEQAESIRRKKNFERLEKRLAAESKKFGELLAMNKTLEKSNKLLTNRLDEVRSKQARIALYESTIGNIASAVHEYQRKVDGGSGLSSLLRSQELPSKLNASFNSTASNGSSTSWADAKDAEDEEQDREEETDSGEEVVLLGTSNRHPASSAPNHQHRHKQAQSDGGPPSRRNWSKEEIQAVEAATQKYGLDWAKVADATGETQKECKKMYKFSRLKTRKIKAVGKSTTATSVESKEAEDEKKSNTPVQQQARSNSKPKGRRPHHSGQRA